MRETSSRLLILVYRIFLSCQILFVGRCNFSGGELNGYTQSLRPLPPVQDIVGLK